MEKKTFGMVVIMFLGAILSIILLCPLFYQISMDTNKIASKLQSSDIWFLNRFSFTQVNLKPILDLTSSLPKEESFRLVQMATGSMLTLEHQVLLTSTYTLNLYYCCTGLFRKHYTYYCQLYDTYLTSSIKLNYFPEWWYSWKT